MSTFSADPTTYGLSGNRHSTGRTTNNPAILASEEHVSLPGQASSICIDCRRT
jgi:hypothetical protein